MRRMVSCIAGLLLALVLAGSAPAGPVEIRILHVNDFHGFAEPHQPLGAEETVGGAAFLAARAHALRLEKASLLLAAGDMIQGHNWANLFQGESVVALMNAMGFDAMVVGNHEFDFGREALRRRIAQARFPVLGANVDGVGGLRPYVIWEVQGARVAVVGVVTQDTPVATHPRNVAGLTFRPALEALRWQVRALRDQADLVVVLSHCGYQADRVLAAAVPGVDVIVGGHSHTRLEHPVAVGRTLIVQAWEHGKALGVLDLTVENGRVVRHEGRLEAIKPGLAPADPSIQALVAGFTGRVDAALSQPVAQALVDLDGERVRERETNFGNLVADIMRTVSGADATIINGGGIRTSIRQGDVSAKHVYAALPFDNYIVAFRLTGRQIRAALEHGVSGVQEGAGRFPQVSGLAFTFSRSAPRGQRVREVLVGGRPLDLQREYTVATNDFLAAGGDGYRAFGEAMAASRDYAVVGGAMQGERLVYNDAGRWLRDVVIERMREMGRLSPRVEGRITEVP